MECNVDDCPRKVRSRGYCNRHYENLRLRGNPVPVRDFSLADRLNHVGWTVTSSGCWEWNGPKNDSGYGRVNAPRLGLVDARAHRLMYEMHNGEIPPGKVVRHNCDNPPCVNPNHLLLGTQAENAADMANRGRRLEYEKQDMRCRKGHDLTEPGSLSVQLRAERIERFCVPCDRKRKRDWMRAKRARAKARVS